MSKTEAPKRERRYAVGSNIVLAADAYGDPQGMPVILLHGGGQTRHAWGGTAAALASAGYYALAVDLRGHGESSWDPLGDYRLEAYARDLHGIVLTLERPPVLVGASLGGMVSLVYTSELYPGWARALVLVDITHKPEPEGVERIVAFMTAHPDGFASLEEAAEAIAEYLPHRPPPRDLSGLEKNLRRGEDGRWRWHWDPAFLMRHADEEQRRAFGDRLANAVRRLSLPTLLVRGRMSDVVSERSVKEFLELAPNAEYADVAGAAHMVAGDENDAFADAVLGFLASIVASPGTPAAQSGR